MNPYMIFLFTIISINQATPMPENSLDSLLPNSKLAKGAEDGSFLQPSLGDSVEQYQPGSFPIAALGLDIIQQRPSIPVDSVQRDQSNSIQVALEDSIRPISGISQANSNYDTSSNLYPNKLDGSNLLANGPTDQKVPNEPIIPPLLFQIIEKVCPSFVLPARACCQGSTQGVTKLPTNIPPNSAAKIFDLFKDMILTSTFVEECYPYERQCENPFVDWCCQFLLLPNDLGFRTGHMCIEAEFVVGQYD